MTTTLPQYKLDATQTPIEISKVKSFSDTSPTKVNTTWPKFCEAFTRPVVRGDLPLADYLQAEKDVRDKQKDGQAIIAGTFFTDDTRVQDQMSSLSLAVADIDDSTYSFDELCARFEALGLEAVVSTTYSHSPAKPKYRAYVLLKMPIAGGIKPMLGQIIDYLDEHIGHIDPACRKPAQLFYTPSCPPGGKEFYQHRHISGAPLDPADFLAPPTKENVQQVTPAGNKPGDDYNVRGSLHDLFLSAGWSHFYRNHYTRPGKKRGISGSILDAGFYCHTSAPEAAPFECGRCYSPFSAYALIHHGGDFSAAARELARQGYGNQAQPDPAEGANEGEGIAEQASRAKQSFPVVPFPAEILPGYLHSITERYSKALQCQFSFMAMAFITVISGAIGNSLRLAIKNSWKAPLFLWLGIIDKTGAGKSHPLEAAMKPLIELQAAEAARYEKEMAEYHLELTAYKRSKTGGEPPREPDPMRHYYSSNFTIESLIAMYRRTARGTVFYVDELAGLIKGLNQYKGGRGSDDEQFLSFFNCGPLKSDRVGKNGFCRESGGACIGGIQPEIYAGVFGEREEANGMLYRWLPLMMNTPPPDFSDDDLTDDDERKWTSVISWMYSIPAEINPETGFIEKTILTVEQSGREAFKAFHDELSHIQPFMPPRFQGYIPKLKTYCLKFIGILHVLECYQHNALCTTVNLATVEKAIKLTHFFAGQALQAVSAPVGVSNPYHAALTKAIESLRNEVVGDRLLLSRVRERMNEMLPPGMQTDASQGKRVATWLHELGFSVVAGAGNKRFVMIV